MGTKEQKGKECEGRPPREDDSKGKEEAEVTDQQVAFARVLAFYYWDGSLGM